MSKSNPELQAELDSLNAEVEAVLAKRKAWMDSHMEDFSEFKVGDEIWDLRGLIRLGIVSRLYRYWAGRDPRYDNQMAIEIEYKVTDGNDELNYYDNTSRHGGSLWYGTKEQAKRRMKSKLEDI